MLENEYQIEYFKQGGYSRKICKKCGMPFWTQDPTREVCGDAPCEPYQFIGNPLSKKHTLNEMREAYLSFFEKNGHTRIERYPVAARWRDDIYLTIASIANFQPYVTSGVCPPPANPLTISQPCIRLNDLDNVGRSGRHFTCFEMMAHHAFNTDDNPVYWKDRCIELCSGFIESIGGDLSNLTFKENPWFGGGNAGASVEVLTGGLEVATLVFMNLSRKDSGKPKVMIDGKDYYEMPLRIVDTGYGLERFVWVSQGTPTAYDAVFPDMVRQLLTASGREDLIDNQESATIRGINAKFAGLMDIRGAKLYDLRQQVSNATGISMSKLTDLIVPMENIYALCDHMRCLAYMLGDLIVPSNIRVGYLARLVLRRSIRMLQEINIDDNIGDLVVNQMEYIGLDQFKQEPAIIKEIIQREVEKYDKTIERGIRTVKRVGQTYINKNESVPLKELMTLYDSHGIPVDLMRNTLTDMHAKFDIPDDFDSQIAEMHSENETKKPDSPLLKYENQLDKLPVTQKSYYDCPDQTEFNATVICVLDDYVILDKTLFYPEGGGQPCDVGVLVHVGNCCDVLSVSKYNDIILHKVSNCNFKPGDTVTGKINKDRRLRLMQHHSATHIVLHAAKEVLGPHIHQAGSQLSPDMSRIDILHYTHITKEQLNQIEIIANKMVMNNIPINIDIVNRIDAEQQFGFVIYQGGVPPGKTLRIVKMGDEIQACAGTHCNKSGDIGLIKLIRIEHIQDGVERLVFAAGIAAIEVVQEIQSTLNNAADLLSVQPGNLPASVERFFNEWKEQRKEIDKLHQHISELEISKISGEVVNDIEIVTKQIDLPRKDLVTITRTIASRGGVAILVTTVDGGIGVVCASGIPDKVHAGKLVSSVCGCLGGKGGGNDNTAQGVVSDITKINESLKMANDMIKSEILRK
ncbi:MAG TPA: alanine--tRNA ligase [Methanocorpusculum sp.]|nr:alanine--tRNA ligase [Methanocorpusculum sp.]